MTKEFEATCRLCYRFMSCRYCGDGEERFPVCFPCAENTTSTWNETMIRTLPPEPKTPVIETKKKPCTRCYTGHYADLHACEKKAREGLTGILD